MQIQYRDGIFDVTDAKPDSTPAIRDFVHLRTKDSTQQAVVEIDDYISSLLFCMILDWKSLRKHQMVENKLNKFEQKVVLDKLFQEMADLIIAEIPSKIVFHNHLIEKWRNRWHKTQLQEVLNECDEINIDIGQYMIVREDGKDKIKIQYDRSFGSNCDAQVKVFLIKKVSDYEKSIFAIITTTYERYTTLKNRYERWRSSYQPDSKADRDSMFKGSRVSDGIRMLDEDLPDRESGRNPSNKQDSQPQSPTTIFSKPNKITDVQPIATRDPPVGFCKTTNNFRVIDQNTQQSLESFQKRNNNGWVDNIIFAAVFLVGLFLLMLIYYNARRERFGEVSEGILGVIDGTAQAAREVLERIMEFSRMVMGEA